MVIIASSMKNIQLPVGSRRFPPQVVSDAAMVVSPSLPALIARLYSVVAVLQLQGVLLPPACTGAAPFETEYSTMGAALGLWLAAVCIYYALHNPYGRLGGQFVLMWAMVRWTMGSSPWGPARAHVGQGVLDDGEGYGRLGGQFVLMWAMPRWTTRRGRLGSRVF